MVVDDPRGRQTRLGSPLLKVVNPPKAIFWSKLLGLSLSVRSWWPPRAGPFGSRVYNSTVVYLDHIWIMGGDDVQVWCSPPIGQDR
jgi:hypothetical protein